MKKLLAVAALAAFVVGPGRALAQSHPEYMPIGALEAALYKPDNGPAPHVGILVMHRTANYLAHPACTEMSKRGFMVLCMNSRFHNNEVAVSFEKLPLDVRDGVLALRRQPGITKVLLFGHSGGGPLMSLYQAVAENGPAYCRGAQKLVECDEKELADLPKADGIIFADAHPSNAILVLRAFNPSVANEDDPPSAPPMKALDPYDPANGYSSTGVSHYTPEFRKAYFAAQSARMNSLIANAQAKMQQIKAGTYPYRDNDIVVIPRGGPQGSGPGASAYLWITDPDVPEIMRTIRPEKLVKNDGSVQTMPITSVAVADPDNGPKNMAFDSGTKVLSLRSFLSANAVTSRDSIEDIDVCRTNNSTICAVQSIVAPTLFLAMGGYYFVRDNEKMFDMAKTKDKDFAVIEGATHFFTPCVPCEPTKGAYSNTMRNLFDYAARWANARF